MSRPAREKKRRRRVLVVTTPSSRPMRAVQRARLWASILVLGDYGAGKTSLAIKMARYWSPVSEHEPATCEALYCQLSNATGVVHD